MLVKTFCKNVGYNMFSTQMLVQLFLRKSWFNFLRKMLVQFFCLKYIVICLINNYDVRQLKNNN
jgi:hypothetical protein